MNFEMQMAIAIIFLLLGIGMYWIGLTQGIKIGKEESGLND